MSVVDDVFLRTLEERDHLRGRVAELDRALQVLGPEAQRWANEFRTIARRHDTLALALEPTEDNRIAIARIWLGETWCDEDADFVGEVLVAIRQRANDLARALSDERDSQREAEPPGGK